MLFEINSVAIRANTPYHAPYDQSILSRMVNWITVANDLYIIRYSAVALVTSTGRSKLNKRGL